MLLVGPPEPVKDTPTAPRLGALTLRSLTSKLAVYEETHKSSGLSIFNCCLYVRPDMPGKSREF